jgi:hypothetical protein
VRIYRLRTRPIAFIKDARVRRTFLCLTISASCLAICLTSALTAENDSSVTRFVYKNADGKIESVKVINSYTGKWTHPFTTMPAKRGGAQLDPMLVRAATIAEERANAHSKSRCWRYVKEALVASGAVSSYPRTEYAREAGDELVRSFGFVRLSVRDPYEAPVGSVLVYGSGRSAGHVEIRTPTGFASDFRAVTPSRRPLIGVYAKISPPAKRSFF